MTYIITLDNHPEKGLITFNREMVTSLQDAFGKFKTSSIYEKGVLVTRIETSEDLGPTIEQYCRDNGYIQ
jgi:hypothetical protein